MLFGHAAVCVARVERPSDDRIGGGVDLVEGETLEELKLAAGWNVEWMRTAWTESRLRGVNAWGDEGMEALDLDRREGLGAQCWMDKRQGELIGREGASGIVIFAMIDAIGDLWAIESLPTGAESNFNLISTKV